MPPACWMKMDQASLLSLPDEALLAVLAYLRPRQLLQCRVLCRRLRDLCLHRQLWKTAKVSKLDVLRAALNLAPCLGKVQVTNLQVVSFLVLGTACVVDALDLVVGDQLDVALATTVLVKLSAVGGVKKLTLRLRCPMSATCSVPMMLKAAANIDGIQELDVFSEVATEPPQWNLTDVELRPSLKKLNYFSRVVDPFLELLLETHAATLEEVFLHLLLEVPTPLLARMPRLRLLACHPCDTLSELANLPSLETIRLSACTSGDGTFPAGVVDFLRRAAHLQTVEFNGPRDVMSVAHLLALAESPSAPRFDTILGVDVAPDLLERVGAMLPKFTSLMRLGVDSVPPNVVLKAISPETLPNLVHLSVRSTDRSMCLHDWLHGPAIQDVLVRNPNLHLFEAGLSTIPDNCACAWCLWGCHGPLQPYGMYSSHTRRADCPPDCYQVAGCCS